MAIDTPAYASSRIHIDMSDAQKRRSNFEQLVRWVYDKPKFSKPELGRAPAYIRDEAAPTTRTHSQQRYAMEAAREGKASAPGLFEEYFELLAERLNDFRVEKPQEGHLDDAIWDGIECLQPVRDEFLDSVKAILRFLPEENAVSLITKAFDNVIPIKHSGKGNVGDALGHLDNLAWFVMESFLYVVALGIRSRLLGVVTSILDYTYSVREPLEQIGVGVHDYRVLYSPMLSMKKRNERLELRRLSIPGDLYHDRSTRSDASFEDLMQADFIAYLRSAITITMKRNHKGVWFPHSLVYGARRTHPFPLFSMARSERILNQVLPILGADSLESLTASVNNISSSGVLVPKWQFDRLDLATLAGMSELGTIP